MRTLTEQVIIEAMRDEWNSRVGALLEKANLTFAGKVGSKSTLLLAPELKVSHKKSKLLYTVDSVSPRDATLRTPDGKLFTVDAKTLEDEYVLESIVRIGS